MNKWMNDEMTKWINECVFIILKCVAYIQILYYVWTELIILLFCYNNVHVSCSFLTIINLMTAKLCQQPSNS